MPSLSTLSRLKPLKGVRIVSLALNLPGPAALWRLRAMGARCTKVDPPAGDPMRLYSAAAFADLSAGLKAVTLDLKAATGQIDHGRAAGAVGANADEAPRHIGTVAAQPHGNVHRTPASNKTCQLPVAGW